MCHTQIEVHAYGQLTSALGTDEGKYIAVVSWDDRFGAKTVYSALTLQSQYIN